MTNEEIIEHQRRMKEFRQTEIGELVTRLENQTAIAWVLDTEGNLNRAEKVFAQQRETRDKLIALLRPLVGLSS